MHELGEAIILGIVQGLTEFLPVSSSGHLEIFKFLLKDQSLGEQSLLTTVFLHFATALSTIYVLRKDIVDLVTGAFRREGRKQRQFIYFIVISMIPAVFVGLYFENFMDELFSQNLLLVGICLLVTAFLLWISEKWHEGKKSLSSSSAFVIGIAQAIAILPGLSRSGATISTSLLLGLKKDTAARFSFLMVVPLIIGKMAKDTLSGDFTANSPGAAYLAFGFIAAFLTGVWACSFMIRLVKASRLHWFSIYCIIVGLLAIGVSEL